MKSKAIISLILFTFLFKGLAIGQTNKTKGKAEKRAVEFYQNREGNLDSLLRLRGTGYAVPNAEWSRAQDSYFQLLDNSSKSSLSFRKEFKENKTINRSYDMEFTKDHKSMSIKINAQAREGIVQIVIIKPDGKNFKVLEVEDMESLGWNHTLNAYTEGNKKEYEGLWQVKVSVKDAKGYFDIKLSLK